jgi:branched-chain amino acid transport system permease protein
MPSLVTVDMLVQVGVVVLLSVGFTFTYMVEKFPNFAHTAIATLGTIVTFTMVRIYGFNPYQTLPVSTLACGFIGLGLYLFLVRPLRSTGAKEITLTFAFFVIAQIIGSLVSIYSYWFLYSQDYPAAGFSVQAFDFTWFSYRGVFIVTLLMIIILVASLYYFFTRVKYGIALRAVAEDEALASSLGVNIFTVHLLSWFLTGALAGLAGTIIPLWAYTRLGYTDQLLVVVMAGSVVGGLNSVAGAVVGGILVSIVQKIFSEVAMYFFGMGFIGYEGLYPIIFIFVVLMIEPEGIMGAFSKGNSTLITVKNVLDRLRSNYEKARQ